jgi:hypothetical protein
MSNCRLVGLKGVAVLQFVGHHFVAVGINGHRGTFSSAATATATPAAVAAAAAATDAALGHGPDEVSVLFHDEIELLVLGFEFRP